MARACLPVPASLRCPGPDGTIDHAEIAYGTGIVMFGSPKEDSPIKPVDGGGYGAYVAVDDPRAHYEHAVREGAIVVKELAPTDYDLGSYALLDCENNRWDFGAYRPTPPI